MGACGSANAVNADKAHCGNANNQVGALPLRAIRHNPSDKENIQGQTKPSPDAACPTEPPRFGTIRGGFDDSDLEIPAEVLRAPQNWKNHGVDFASFEPVDESLKSGLAKLLRESSTGGHVKLVQALRVEHSQLWNRYARKRFAIHSKRTRSCTPLKHLGCQLPSADSYKSGKLQDKLNEVYLWCGTSPDTAVELFERGTALSMADFRARGLRFGRGAYFQESSSMADIDAQSNTGGIYKGLYCLLLCRVTLGESLLMTMEGECTRGLIEAAMSSRAYDSVMAGKHAGSVEGKEFVVYNDGQIYPEYVLLYSK